LQGIVQVKIIIEAIPKAQMRYDTAGDWFQDGGDLRIQVDEALPVDEQFLIALHELVEVKLCIMRGISQQMVDDFDMNSWPVLVAAVPGLADTEPGDHPAAPYRMEHRQAALVEHVAASFMGLAGYGIVA